MTKRRPVRAPPKTTDADLLIHCLRKMGDERCSEEEFKAAFTKGAEACSRILSRGLRSAVGGLARASLKAIDIVERSQADGKTNPNEGPR